MMHADLLILLTDIDGLYTANPTKDENARHIDVVEKVTDDLLKAAGGAGSSNGTGGMRTKLTAARLATKAGVPRSFRAFLNVSTPPIPRYSPIFRYSPAISLE